MNEKAVSDMLKYQPFGGQSIEQWFRRYGEDDLNRIFAAVQKGVANENLSVQNVIKDMFSDNGAIAQSRNAARTLARTITISASNHTAFETYKAVMEQGDDITAIEFSAKFDSRLCPVCALMDRQRWTLETINETKIPPLHPNCRCMLLPINEISDSFEREKTGKAENFEQKAKERHNANPKRQKDWDELSYDTRVQKYYDEVKRYENETGKPAYREIGNATFEEYLKSQPAKFQEEWLGKERYQRWKRGELKLDQLVDPDKGYRRTLADLEQASGKADKTVPAANNASATVAAIGLKQRIDAKVTFSSAQTANSLTSPAKSVFCCKRS
jgi:SPP1 gp7 family putative phage head morphogenesis protein